MSPAALRQIAATSRWRRFFDRTSLRGATPTTRSSSSTRSTISSGWPMAQMMHRSIDGSTASVRKRNTPCCASMARMDDVGTATTVREPGQAHRAATVAVDFESFFLAHHLRLFRALWLMTRNRHEAEEIMQDAFLRVWERWERVAG